MSNCLLFKWFLTKHPGTKDITLMHWSLHKEKEFCKTSFWKIMKERCCNLVKTLHLFFWTIKLRNYLLSLSLSFLMNFLRSILLGSLFMKVIQSFNICFSILRHLPFIMLSKDILQISFRELQCISVMPFCPMTFSQKSIRQKTFCQTNLWSTCLWLDDKSTVYFQ